MYLLFQYICAIGLILLLEIVICILAFAYKDWVSLIYICVNAWDSFAVFITSQVYKNTAFTEESWDNYCL